VLITLFLQFVFLPFLGYLVVTAFSMARPAGLTLLVVTSSPGGSYSNWWCSMFNVRGASERASEGSWKQARQPPSLVLALTLPTPPPRTRRPTCPCPSP
jgi:hypothetical protein